MPDAKKTEGLDRLLLLIRRGAQGGATRLRQ